MSLHSEQKYRSNMERICRFSLDFTEDNVHIGSGDILAVDDAAVLTEFDKVFAVHLLPGGLGVSVDGKLLE